jgi:hypothetical protein
VPQDTTVVHPVELPSCSDVPPVAGVGAQDGSGQVCHIQGGCTKSLVACLGAQSSGLQSVRFLVSGQSRQANMAQQGIGDLNAFQARRVELKIAPGT